MDRCYIYVLYCVWCLVLNADFILCVFCVVLRNVDICVTSIQVLLGDWQVSRIVCYIFYVFIYMFYLVNIYLVKLPLSGSR